MAQSFLDKAGYPLGLRNNNPGNLRPLGNGQTWQGEIGRDYANNFSRFSDVAYGLRAMITDITGDIVANGRNTLRKLINAYAPGSENNTGSYITRVSQLTGINPDAVIIPTRTTIEKIVKAMLSVELGATYAGKLNSGDFNEAFARLSSQVANWLNIAGKGTQGAPGAILVVLILTGVALALRK